MPQKKKQKVNKEAVDSQGGDDNYADWCDKWPTIEFLKHSKDDADGDDHTKVPQRVCAVPRLTMDVEALLELSLTEARQNAWLGLHRGLQVWGCLWCGIWIVNLH